MYDIVMIGSSIFEFWGQPNWRGCNVANHAIRSTHSQYWLDYDLSVLPSSRSIIVYCGSNDLVFGEHVDDITANIKILLDKLSQHFPEAKIGYFSILKCPQKAFAGQLGIINHINFKIKEFSSGNIQYIEFNDFIENDKQWYIDDGLHLTDQAYAQIDAKMTNTMRNFVGL